MRFKANYLVIPLIAFSAASFGGWLTDGGMEWYRTIRLPSFTPPGRVIGTVWTVIYTLSAASALIVWNRAPRTGRFRAIVGLFTLNVVLNVLWSFLFFRLHWMGVSTGEAALLGLTVVGLIVLIWPISRLASLLLVPYAAWVAFATFLTFSIWRLN